MKMNSNLAVRIAGGAAILGLLAPSLAGAQTATSTPGAQFCKNVNALQAALNAKMAANEKSYRAIKADAVAKITAGRKQIDAWAIAQRASWDSYHLKQYAKVAALATTTSQRQAFTTFKEEVTSATKAKRQAIDAAIAAYRKGLDDTLNDRKDGFEALRKDYKARVDAAMADAKRDCADGDDPKAVRTATAAELKDIHQDYIDGIRNLEKNGPAIAALEKTRNDAIKKAQETFKAALDAAFDKLEDAF